MPIQLTWTDPAQTRLRLDFTAPWDWIDYQFAVSIGTRDIEAQAHPVDLLVDLSRNLSLPPGAFGHFRDSLQHRASNLSTICIVVEPDSVASLFVRAFIKTCPDLCTNLVVVHSVEEAHHLLDARVPVTLRA